LPLAFATSVSGADGKTWQPWVHAAMATPLPVAGSTSVGIGMNAVPGSSRAGRAGAGIRDPRELLVAHPATATLNQP